MTDDTINIKAETPNELALLLGAGVAGGPWSPDVFLDGAGLAGATVVGDGLG